MIAPRSTAMSTHVVNDITSTMITQSTSGARWRIAARPHSKRTEKAGWEKK